MIKFRSRRSKEEWQHIGDLASVTLVRSDYLTFEFKVDRKVYSLDNATTFSEFKEVFDKHQMWAKLNGNDS